MTEALPVLYSFRRCPYAMRARMALRSAKITLEHREVLLKNKPPAMLVASAKGTVPVLILDNGEVIDESWGVVQWALNQNDPENLLGVNNCFLEKTRILVEECDGQFKRALDQYKYADKHPLSAEIYRERGMKFLGKLDHMLSERTFLLASHCSIADIAVMPFVRQFAHVDKNWFSLCGLNHLGCWLNAMLKSDVFTNIMQKHPVWEFDQTR